MTKWFASGLLVFVIGLCVWTNTKADHVCIKVDEVVSTMEKRFPGAKHKMVPEENLETFMAAYNRSPPRSELESSGVIVFYHPDQKDIKIVVLSKKGCANISGNLSPEDFKSLMEGMPIGGQGS